MDPTSSPGPDARALADRLGLDDPSRFRRVRRVPIFDAHEPIAKTARDPALISEENPAGLVKVEIGCTAADLEEMARNANARAASGRPPSLQLGHTDFKAALKDEPYLPRHVGVATDFTVGDLDGRPTLFADLCYLASEFAEAATYPRVSGERIGWDEPGGQTIKAVALLRRDPELDLGLIPYGRESGGTALLCYSREMATAAPDLNPMLEPSPSPEPPNPESFMDPEQQKAFCAMLVAALVPALAAAAQAQAPTVPESETTSETPPVANYEAAAPGGDNTYIPGMAPADPTKMAEYKAECARMAHYAREVPDLRKTIEGLKTENATLTKRLADFVALDARMKALEEESFSRQVNYEKDRLDNHFKDLEAKGIRFDREVETELYLAIDDEALRRKHLATMETHYARSATGQPFLPHGQKPPKGHYPTDPGSRQKIKDYAVKQGITGIQAAYDKMLAEGLL